MIDFDMERRKMLYALPPLGMVQFGNVLVHNPARCESDERGCPLHRPSAHHMVDWDMVLRIDNAGLIERNCPHGVGHPDPDSVAFMKGAYMLQDSTLTPDDLNWVGVHGCDGCCIQEEEREDG